MIMQLLKLKNFFKLAMIFIFLAIVLSLYTFWIEPNQIVVKTTALENTGLNMKIVFMSDFQRASTDPTFVQRAVDIANAQNPDLIVLGGDYLEYYDFEFPSIAPLKNLKATYGIYGVLGNHDYRALSLTRLSAGCPIGSRLEFANKIKDFLESDGNIHILRNEQKTIAGVTLIGLDDLWGCARNETKALSNFSSNETVKNSYRIMISHNQDELKIDKQTADLYLFAHTHCGQVRIPFLGSIPKLAGFKGTYDDGYYFVNGTNVYTTCGLAPAPHFLSPPEVTVFELR